MAVLTGLNYKEIYELGTLGKWPLAVLTGDRSNGGVFFIRKRMTVFPGQKKVTVIKR